MCRVLFLHPAEFFSLTIACLYFFPPRNTRCACYIDLSFQLAHTKHFLMFFFQINFLIYRVRDWVYQRSFTFSLQEGSLFGLLFRAFIQFPITFQGQPGKSSIARVERAHSYRAHSGNTGPTWVHFLFFIVRVAQAQKIIRLHSLLCSASKMGTWLLPIQSFRYPPLRPQGEQPDCPSLRASDEHCFIVRVLRARRMVWLLPSHSSFDRPTPSRL